MPTDTSRSPVTVRPWGMFALLLLFDTAAQMFFKAGALELGAFPIGPPGQMLAQALAMLSNPYILAGAATLLGAFVLWITIISKTDLSEAHPISCLVYGTVAIASTIIFGEIFTPWQSLGIVLIIMGVFIISKE